MNGQVYELVYFYYINIC